MRPKIVASRGFTLIEIMIVVAIIALLAAIAIPGFLRARKRSQAVMIKTELKLIDSALDQYALESHRSDGPVPFAALTGFFPNGRLAASAGNDALGNPFERLQVGTVPRLSDATYTALSDVIDVQFWSPFYP